MALTIVQNDILHVKADVLVNTANEWPMVGTGCDYAIYQAAGYETLLNYRKEKIGQVAEGEVFMTPSYALGCKFLIHAVSPFYLGGDHGEEEKLRNCYQKALALAVDNHAASIAFPLISTGGFGYPKEEGLSIAVDEINRFLLKHDIEVYLVLFSNHAAGMGRKIYPGLQSFIDENYVEEQLEREYCDFYNLPDADIESAKVERRQRRLWKPARKAAKGPTPEAAPDMEDSASKLANSASVMESVALDMANAAPNNLLREDNVMYFYEEGHDEKLKERVKHLSDTFSEYLLYLISLRGLKNVKVYQDAGLDKKVFSKIKNHPDYHPKKQTALCLCIGAHLNLDESKDLLARAGYALSPCDLTDIIFQYFIENQIYDIFELDNQLEAYGMDSLLG